jgi:hypothetical protein
MIPRFEYTKALDSARNNNKMGLERKKIGNPISEDQPKKPTLPL